MKRIFLLIAVLLAASACGDDDTPSTPANNNNFQFKATLATANEVPPLANAAEAAARGEATIDLVLTRDSAGTITAAVANFRVDMTNFLPTSAIRAAHIHNAPAGQSAGIYVDAGVSPGQVTLTNGVGTFSRLGVTVPVDRAQAILNNPPGFYFNVHSDLNTGGVIRGQLVQQ
jgi:hypothetical protein